MSRARRLLDLGLLLIAGCGEVATTVDAPGPDASGSDAPSDAPAGCDPASAFGPPAAVRGLEAVVGGAARFSPDELTVYFTASDVNDIFTARRSSLTEPFPAPEPATELNGEFNNIDPTLSADGLRVWLASNRLNSRLSIFVASRSSANVAFNPPTAETVNGTDPRGVVTGDGQPFVTADGQELWFTSNRDGGRGGVDLWRAEATATGFAAPENIAALNSTVDDWFPMLSADRLTVYFSSLRTATGARGKFDIWTAHRDTLDGAFSPPTLVDAINSSGEDFATWLSPDNCRLYGYSDVGGAQRIFVATRSR